MTKNNRRRALIGGSIAATLLSKSQVSADGWGGDIGWYWADSGTHTFCQSTGVSNSEFDVVEDRMAYLDNFTDMVDSLVSCSSTTDVVTRDVSLGFYGQASCLATGGTGICDSFLMEIDYGYHVGLPFEELEQTACHEIGHTIGFWHDTADSANSCMMSPQQATGNHYIYSQHHKDHINARW